MLEAAARMQVFLNSRERKSKKNARKQGDWNKKAQVRGWRWQFRSAVFMPAHDCVISFPTCNVIWHGFMTALNKQRTLYWKNASVTAWVTPHFYLFFWNLHIHTVCCEARIGSIDPKIWVYLRLAFYFVTVLLLLHVIVLKFAFEFEGFCNGDSLLLLLELQINRLSCAF